MWTLQGFGVAEHEWDHFVHHSTRPVDDTSSIRLHYDPAIAAPFKVVSGTHMLKSYTVINVIRIGLHTRCRHVGFVGEN
jgi:hypothetical protein